MAKLNRYLISILIMILMLISTSNAIVINVPSDQPTIQAGIDASSNGDTVLVAPGTYTENFVISGKSIVLTSSSGAESTIIQPLNSSVATIIIGTGSGANTLFQGFTVTGGGVTSTFLVYNSSPTIRDNIFHNNIPIGSSNIEVISCSYSDALITRNLFYENGGIGCVGLRTSAHNTKIINNTFDRNERGFFSIAGGGTALNNIVTNSIERGIGTLTPSNFLVFDYNNVWNNNPDFLGGGVSGANDISEDPLYTDELVYDYSLNSLSPCIDVGDPSAQYNDPDGSRNDMGAYFLTSIIYPIANNLIISPSIGDVVLSETPTITWQYSDTILSTQVKYRIEVGTDSDWSVAEMWNSGEISSSDTSVVYGGSALQHAYRYYLRISVSNGTSFGDWRGTTFVVRSKNTTIVPIDVPTIQMAIDVSIDGDTVLVQPGTYVENLNFNGRSIVLLSTDGPLVTIITPEIPSWNCVIMNSAEDSTTKINGFTITGCLTNTILLNGTSPTIENNIFHDNITFGSDNIEVISCSDASALITRNLFYDNGGIGCVGLRSGSGGTKIINNTFDRNQRGFFSIAGGGTALNNIVTNSIERGIGTLNPSDFSVFDYNNIWNNNPDFLVGGVGGANDISADPIYINELSFDYNIEYSSPCIDAGDPDTQYNDPDGTRNDIGAFPSTGVNYPVANNIQYSPAVGNIVLSENPLIIWIYNDTAISSQASYELEIGTDIDWSVAELWNTGDVLTSDTEVVYNGNVLEHGNIYYLRIRVNNGIAYGDWRNSSFIVKLKSGIIVPIDYPTIQEAIDASFAGDTIEVLPGTYIENINFNGKSIVLVSTAGPSSTIIAPNNPWAECIVIASAEDNSTKVSGFTITGCLNRALMLSGTSPTIENNIFHNNISFGTSNREAITCISSSALIIRNLFYENGGIGCVGLRGGSEGTRIINNTFDRNERGFFSIADGGIALNNIVTNSIERGIGTLTPSNFSVFDYNNVWNNNPNFNVTGVTGPNDISLDPKYSDTTVQDYSLSVGSPCIGAGNPDPIYNDPNGTRNDMGAFPDCCTVRGDLNQNGEVEIDDLTYIIDFFFKGGSFPSCLSESDANSSGGINIEDLTFLVNYMFKSGPAPGVCK